MPPLRYTEDVEPSVWFITPVYQRFALTELCLKQRRWMLDRLPFHAKSVVIGDDENLEVADRLGFDTVEMDNKYVGRKFNAGYQWAKEEGATHCMAIGSDSWLHPSVFEGHEWDKRALGLCNLSSFSPDGLERIDLNVKYPAGFGVGMVYPAWCLQREPCSPSKNKGCDTSTWARNGRGRIQITFEEVKPYTYLNFHSSDVQITHWQQIKGSYRQRANAYVREGGTDVLHGLYPDDLVQMLEGLFAARALGVMFNGQPHGEPWSPEWKGERMRRRRLPTAEARRLSRESVQRGQPERKIIPQTKGDPRPASVDKFRAILGRDELGGR